ncbi:MAG TPA: TIGR02757 family protein [Bacteroidales bacterium]|nr:TIGR02757 family protein [Bacteroidales bacterium]
MSWMKPPSDEMRDFLEQKYREYNQQAFIESDPIQIPHMFEAPEDIEISGFMAATIAWGQRPTIISNMNRLLDRMNHTPYEFLIHSDEEDLERFHDFKHRTFNGADCIFFLQALKNIYLNHGGLRPVFEKTYLKNRDIREALVAFHKTFFEIPYPMRTRKHVADIRKRSSAKRLNMFLRWMVRRDPSGVDFGIWKGMDQAHLYMPLDVHSGKVARQLGLLQRKQNDWQAVEELTDRMREFDPQDPVKYDYALFGLGVFEKF